MKEERTVTTVKAALGSAPKRLRTAAYARVSSGKESMLHSLSAQVSFYSGFIQSNPAWQYCGVYAEMLTPSLIQMHPTCTQIAP